MRTTQGLYEGNLLRPAIEVLTVVSYTIEVITKNTAALMTAPRKLRVFARACASNVNTSCFASNRKDTLQILIMGAIHNLQYERQAYKFEIIPYESVLAVAPGCFCSRLGSLNLS